MKFTISQADYDALPEALRGFYSKRESDGKWVLQCEGAVPQERFVEFRDNNIALKRDLDAWKALGVTAEEVQDLLKKRKDIEDGRRSDGRTVKEIVEEQVGNLKKQHDMALKEAQDKLQKSKAELQRLKIGGTATKKALELGLRPEAQDDLVARVSGIFTLEDDGSVVAKNPDGSIRYSAKTTEPLTLEEYVSGLVEQAPHFFAPSSGSGANQGGNGNRGRNGSPGVNPFKKETYNLTEQGQLLRSNPDLARRMAKEAGVTLPG